MTLLDHALIFVLVAVHPVAGYISYQRLVRQARNGEIINRGKLYVASLLQQWVLFAVCIAMWAGFGRSFESLGFGFAPDALFIGGALLTAAATIGLYLQYRQLAKASQEDLDRYRASVGTLDIIIPRNGNELGRFYALSMTAGIVEETLWRGFFIWYLVQFMPVWAAAVVSSIAFGVAHAYQGPANIPKIVLIGGVFAAIFLMTGSLWLAMLLHAVMDIVQGRLGYELFRRTDGDAPPADRSNGSPGVTEPA